jgi:endonuclease/exonuclease/phosphatase family metal-dependent hydrolase
MEGEADRSDFDFGDEDWNEYWYNLDQDEIRDGGDGTSGTIRYPDTLVFMTYNIQKKKYEENGKLIKASGADVVAVQELSGERNFNKLKNAAGMTLTIQATDLIDGTGAGVAMLWNVLLSTLFFNPFTGIPTPIFLDPFTVEAAVQANYKFAIGLMWRPDLGHPSVTKRTMRDHSDYPDTHRAYIIAEFRDFCFVATHYSHNVDDQEEMTNAILDEDVIKDCISKGKPVYIAGDLNPKATVEKPDIILPIFEANGFVLLNDLNDAEQATRPNGSSPDRILEYNKNDTHELIKSGIPLSWDDNTMMNKLSDHRPYFVKVKIK